MKKCRDGLHQGLVIGSSNLMEELGATGVSAATCGVGGENRSAVSTV
jgi:hypothetical protein